MAKKPYPSEIADRFQVRMPDGLRERVAEAAKANNRSMNAEIVARLELTFAVDDHVGGDIAADNRRIAQQIADIQEQLKIVTAAVKTKTWP